MYKQSVNIVSYVPDYADAPNDRSLRFVNLSLAEV